MIHTDLHQLKSPTHDGYKYWVTFIDDCCEWRAVIFLKAKSQVFEAFKTYKSYAENALGRKIKFLQHDKGGEYMSNTFKRFFDESGIRMRHSTRNHPQQNGVAERANRTIDEHTTAMLSQANLPPSFKGEAVAAYIHSWNRCLTSNSNQTPYERWFGKKPDVSYLRIWGCTAFVHIQRDKHVGIGSHMEKGLFIGYPDGYKAWRFYNPTTRRFSVSERAEFDEHSMNASFLVFLPLLQFVLFQIVLRSISLRFGGSLCTILNRLLVYNALKLTTTLLVHLLSLKSVQLLQSVLELLLHLLTIRLLSTPGHLPWLYAVPSATGALLESGGRLGNLLQLFQATQSLLETMMRLLMHITS